MTSQYTLSDVINMHFFTVILLFWAELFGLFGVGPLDCAELCRQVGMVAGLIGNKAEAYDAISAASS